MVPVLTVVVQLLSLALLVMAVVGAYRRLRADRGPVDGPAAEPVPRPALSPDAVAAEQAWRRARAEFQRLRGEFAAHEADPLAVLRRPALSDTTVAATARFVDAFAEAQALDTDGYPGEPHAATHVRAVDAARRAWTAAVDAADRIRLAGLDPEERRTVERVVKLLTTARDSDSEPERLAAYGRARAELDRLERSGRVHLPRPARARLDAAARGELPGP
ncbi:hypothetical protein FVA95_11515 [Pseudonocardia sp. EV170527-09]|uniref:hypothetical protein n=1 Tax=Pseudonocardia sp. EV170527-09 TaxID=2603411 RepID=UPI0011F2D304|nr:hypothetical protein [Pseudonocardia sp. EV170527-09]KAA1029292.1 hypothetical protein FVA95_11515 [Pseudonocardia sp. EV170527-09]